MGASSVFKAYVEPTLERIPILEVQHAERHQGRDFLITQTVNRNVFTDFDRKLSRHLAAVRGVGFPTFTVSVKVAQREAPDNPRSLAPAHHPSVPHALKGIAERAFSHRGAIELVIHHSDEAAGDRGEGIRRRVTAEDIDSLDTALGVCRLLGEAEFLDISGDFDIVMAAPPGGGKPVLMHLANGSVTVPCGTGDSTQPFECPLYGFAGHAGANLLAQSYLASARHRLAVAKENAVLEFRAAAEARILGFDRALGTRSLEDHRLEIAVSLVERLKLGLGDSLQGLAEDARVTALDWADMIDGRAAQHISLAHAAAGG
jgi:hypothetical protein